MHQAVFPIFNGLLFDSGDRFFRNHELGPPRATLELVEPTLLIGHRTLHSASLSNCDNFRNLTFSISLCLFLPIWMRRKMRTLSATQKPKRIRIFMLRTSFPRESPSAGSIGFGDIGIDSQGDPAVDQRW